MDLTPSTDTWCIDDTLFFPLGLINHTTGNKRVFVTWSDKCLMNFIFKESSESANRCSKFIINLTEEILDIIILEVNTLVILKNGEVCYFSSIKSMHRIPWLNGGVRCASKSMDGFSLIRVLEDKRITLEIYNDVPNVGKTPQKLIKSFDLTFDEENLFDSDWSQDRFTLVSVGITDRNRKFIQLLVRDVGLQALEIHIFSISNNLFALHASEGDDYEIKSLAPQVSTIEWVKFVEEENMLLVYLNCGIVEVWYMSKIAWIIERHTYTNGSEFIHYTFAGNILYFTDEQRVCRLLFAYDNVEHTCQIVEHSIDAPGMVAVTYEEVSGSLVCLSNNNIFYHLSFKDSQQADDEDHAEEINLFELTDEKAQEILSRSHLIDEVISLPEKIDKQIEEEYKKQELIAVRMKSAIYSELITADVSFSQHIPETNEILIYPGESGIPPFTYFAIVTLKILSHEIFESTLWNLMIAYSSHIRLLSITTELLRNEFSVLIPVKRKHNELIPKFEIQMLAYVNLEQDFVCINVPVKLQTVNVQKLFSRNQGLTKFPEAGTKGKSFCFKTVAAELDLSHIRKMFGLPVPQTSENEVEDEILIQALFFLGIKVILVFNESSKIISVESCDPVAIYYAKICISKYLWEHFEPTSDDYEELRNSILDLQSQVETKYGALVEQGHHCANLKRIYEKLRKEIIWKF